MLRKILCMGAAFFLCFGCVPYMVSPPEKKTAENPSSNGQEFSLFTPAELERLFSQESTPSRRELLASADFSAFGSPSGSRIAPPISDESNDDFSLEVSPGDLSRKGSEFDIPIVINEKVEYFIQYFQTTLRNKFALWLAQSERYIPIMKSLLRENGLPEDLVYLALIESGFNPYAYSRSKATGPWQFIYLTGKRYGLKVTGWVDERRDPEKSTIAAAKYLKDLYDMFECWYLAAAGYNAGENKIARGIRRYQTEDFWELAKTGYLKQETRDYVPQMIAAALIAKDPEKYGFTGIAYMDPLRYEKATIPRLTDLAYVAKACEVPLEELKGLNPELSRGCTPPDTDEYELKIPFGKKELFLKNFEALLPLAKMQMKTHTVKKGETFARIARLYRIDIDSLMEMNGQNRGSRTSPGMKLLIPIPAGQHAKAASPEKTGTNSRASSSGVEEITYIVKKGDTLWNIANEMGVNIGVISQWNRLSPEKKLIPGDKLRIRMGHQNPAAKTPQRKEERKIIYTVKEGDTLWTIAKKYGLTVSQIKTWNRLNGKDRIFPSDKLTLMTKS